MNAIAKSAVEDQWDRRVLKVNVAQWMGCHLRRGRIQGNANATSTRWYGFAFTYPNCDIYRV
ncbi:hypothetical protein KFU94_60665 [Chloroflexi bacterium TSY]|nr:hypothetical protein [Chloroflexi bacterium TSY]